jgi:hypothetical protein
MTPQEIVYSLMDGTVSWDEFVTATQGVGFEPLTRHGEVVGCVMKDGHEVHVALRPGHQKRYCFRKELQSILGGLIADFGYAITKVRHEGNHEFVKRIGFKETHFDMFNVYYKLTEVRHGTR